MLKPNPHLILIDKAVHDLDAIPIASALAGDSFTDIEAAHRTRVASIGYANRPGKRERMMEFQAEAVIASMADLALSLCAHSINLKI